MRTKTTSVRLTEDRINIKQKLEDDLKIRLTDTMIYDTGLRALGKLREKSIKYIEEHDVAAASEVINGIN